MTERGTTNGNARGSTQDRARRRAWLMVAWASDVPHFTRCYRCGVLLYNPDDEAVEVGTGLGHPARWVIREGNYYTASALTIDRVVPGCQGGTYRRNNTRPACGGCNSKTGGATRRKGTP